MKLGIFFVLVVLVFARQNPFADPSNNNQISNNNPQNFDKFKETKITLPNSARLIKEITIKYQNIDGSISQTSQKQDRLIDWHNPIVISHKFNATEQKGDYTSISLKTKNVQLSYLGRYLRIATKLEIKNSFFLSDPYRVVIDFVGNIDKTENQKINNDFYKNVSLSNHDGLFRITLELDTFYSYIIEKTTNGYILGLR